MNAEQLAEYQEMRREILARATMHHNQLTVAIAMQLVGLVVLVWLVSSGAGTDKVNLFFLGLPIIFAGLMFNYQANQRTMEIVAKYLNKQYGASGLGWEEFFGREKKKYLLTSFLKALPLLWPLFIPVIMWSYSGWPAEPMLSTLMSVDLVLLVLTLANFRYKAS